MNKIDKKYKDQLGHREFPESVKMGAWQKAEKMLDAKMPIAGHAKIKRAGLGWFKAGLAILAIGVTIPLAWLYFNEEGSVEEINSQIVTEPVEVNTPIANEEGGNPKELENSDLVSSNETSIKIESEDGLEEIEPPTPIVSTEAKSNIISEAGANQTITERATPSISLQQEPDVLTSSEISNEVIAQGEVNRQDESSTPGNINHSDKRALSNQVVTAAVIPAVTSSDLGSAETKVETGQPIKESESLALPKDENAQPAEALTDNDIIDTDLVADDPSENEDVVIPETTEDDALVVQEKTEDELGNDDRVLEPAEDLMTNQGESEDEKKIANKEEEGEPDEDEEINPIVHKFTPLHLSISAFGGYVYVDKAINSDDDTYDGFRDQGENGIWSSIYGLDLTYNLSERFTITSGLWFSGYGEKIDYEPITSIEVAGIDGRFNSPSEFNNILAIDSTRVVDGIFLGHWDYDIIYLRTDSSVLAANGQTNVRYLEIPFLAGYSFGKGWAKPWVKTGVSLGIPVQSQTLWYLGTESVGYGLIENTSSPLLYNYILNLGIDVEINTHFSLGVMGLGSYNLNSAINQKGIRQQYYRIGAGLQLTYRF